jgi:hypothetical protein
MTKELLTVSPHEQEPSLREGNFNDEVLVRITPTGEAIWRDFYADAREFYTSQGEPNPYVIERNEDGYTRIQIWQFATIFGAGMYHGNNTPPVEMGFKFVTRVEAAEASKIRANSFGDQVPNSTSGPNMCSDSPEEGRHYWYHAGYMEQSSEKFVCGFCSEVIYD